MSAEDVLDALRLDQADAAVLLNIGLRTVQRCVSENRAPGGAAFVIWEALSRLAAWPRPLVIEGDSRALRRWMAAANGDLSMSRRQQLWGALIAAVGPASGSTS